MKKLLFHLSLFTFFSTSLFAQKEACSCPEVFEQLAEKVHENYIGLKLANASDRQAFNERLIQTKKEAEQTSLDNCALLLQQLLRFFEDGHLFVSEFPKPAEDILAAHKKTVTEKKYDPDKVRKLLLNTPAGDLPVLGLWTDGQSKYGIIKNDHADWDFDYVAVILDGADKEKIGEIKVGFDEKKGHYEGTYFSNQYIPRYTAVFPQKDGELLGIWGGFLWGKIPIKDKASFEEPPFDPSLPGLEQLNEETVLLSIPTFLIEKKSLDQLLKNNSRLLTSARYLIVDIRGNSGGNGIYFDLIRLYANRPIESKIGKALSSKDNMDYFEKFARDTKDNPYFPVLEDMKKAPGQVVKGPRFSSTTLKPIPSKLEKVVILSNEDNKSAAETFILHSKKASAQVVTVGQNTAGVVDYNNINMVRISCEESGIYLGYPMYTYHDRIPEDGYNKTGIPPDIQTDKRGRELIEFTLNYLKKQ